MTNPHTIIVILTVILPALIVFIRYLLRNGGLHRKPHQKSSNPDKERVMKTAKEFGGFIAIGIIVAAIIGAVLELSNWHIGEVAGAMLVLALTTSFMVIYLGGNIPSGMRPALAVVAAICWLGLVIHEHWGNGTGWTLTVFAAAVAGPIVLAIGADIYYEAKSDEPTIQSALN